MLLFSYLPEKYLCEGAMLFPPCAGRRWRFLRGRARMEHARHPQTRPRCPRAAPVSHGRPLRAPLAPPPPAGRAPNRRWRRRGLGLAGNARATARSNRRPVCRAARGRFERAAMEARRRRRRPRAAARGGPVAENRPAAEDLPVARLPKAVDVCMLLRSVLAGRGAAGAAAAGRPGRREGRCRHDWPLSP